MSEVFRQVIDTVSSFDILGIAGFVFGLLAVIFLIYENIWTWPFGILYVLVSLIVFTQEHLFGDLLLHFFYLVLNIYGWYYWINGKKKNDKEVPISYCPTGYSLKLLFISLFGVFIFGYFLEHINDIFSQVPASSLPYWDAATSILSVTGMWLTAKKKIENWYYWLVVDILATGVYFYKGIYFYALLYLIYIVLAVVGYLNWRKLYRAQKP